MKTTAYVRRAANAVAIARGAEFFGLMLEVMMWFHLSESIFYYFRVTQKGDKILQNQLFAVKDAFLVDLLSIMV